MNGRSLLAAWSRRPSRIVATIGIVAGLGFALLTPPLAGYDESVHFLRAYQVSSGGLIATQHGKQLGGDLPLQLPRDLARLLRDGVFSQTNKTDFVKHLNDAPARGPKTFVDFAPGAVYSPVTYAPAALLMAIGRALGVSTLMLLYLGRIGGLLATVGLLTLAVRRMPTRAGMLAAVALLPVTVFQAAMLSADGVTIALALLVLAQALDLAATPRDHPGTRHIATRRLVEIAATTIVLGFAKPPYILFALAFAIPWRRHGGRVRRAIAASVGAGFAAAAGWAAYASSVYVAPKLPPGYAGPLGPFTVYTHVDPGRQERFVAHHPLSFVKAIARTLAHFGRDLARQTVAQVPRTLPVAVAVAALMVLVVGILIPDPEASNGGSALSWRGRLLLLGIAGATFVTLMLLAYTGWNAVGAPRIDAFQGRYLLPLVPLVLLALPARRPSPAAAWTGSALAALSGALLVAVGIGLTSRFY